jgi:hypothetical protein
LLQEEVRNKNGQTQSTVVSIIQQKLESKKLCTDVHSDPIMKQTAQFDIPNTE